MDGGYSADEKVRHYQARKLKIKASPKLEVMADGIALGKGTVTMKIRSGALRVITAEKNPGFGTRHQNVGKMILPVALSQLRKKAIEKRVHFPCNNPRHRVPNVRTNR
jgi:hypothetical protein